MQNLKTWCWVLSDSARKYDHLTAQEVDELKSSGRPMLTKVFSCWNTKNWWLRYRREDAKVHMILFHSLFVCLFVFFTSIDEIPSKILCPKFSHRFRACKIYDQVVCFTRCGYVCSQITFWNLAQLSNANPTNIIFSSASSDGYTAPDICSVCHWNDSTFSSLGPV